MQLEAIHRPGIVLGADDALHRTDTAARDSAFSPRLHNPLLRFRALVAEREDGAGRQLPGTAGELRTSKVRTYAPPRPKRIVGWPGIFVK
ncbi:hypothetical protein [Burkholderia sp. SIMBA_062]|uniref:hypothetical protein n=1 Tax=Burkholderia sp. SIMBA_062 TaxID=3085803 RepID=UPI00397AEC8A